MKSQWNKKLDQIHPAVLEHYLDSRINDLAYDTGVDDEIEAKFSEPKTIIALENNEDRLLAEGAYFKMVDRAKEYRFDHYLDFFPLYALFWKLEEIEDKKVEPTLEDVLDYASGDLARQVIHNMPSIAIRNLNWLPKITTALATHRGRPVLLMVGVAHLPGKNGLIRLMENQGFRWGRVTR